MIPMNKLKKGSIAILACEFIAKVYADFVVWNNINRDDKQREKKINKEKKN